VYSVANSVKTEGNEKALTTNRETHPLALASSFSSTTGLLREEALMMIASSLLISDMSVVEVTA